MLNSLSNSNQFLKTLWKTIEGNINLWSYPSTKFRSMLNLLCISFGEKLSVMDDEEFSKIETPFNQKEIIKITENLKNIMFQMYWDSSFKDELIRNNLTSLIKMIYSKDIRRKFCPNDHWNVSEIANTNIFSIKGSDLAPEKSEETVELWDDFQTPDRYETLEQSMNITHKSKPSILSEKEEKIRVILRNIPFVIPFPMRLKLFHQFIEQDHKRDYNFIPPVVVRRDYIFEDGYSNLYKLDLKNNINVQFKNKEGLLESGIGQGVFKEFVTE